jgi:amino acid permease
LTDLVYCVLTFWAGYTVAIAVPAEISAAAVLIQFWTQSINPAVWITIFVVFIVVVNFCGVRLYGEVSVLSLLAFTSAETFRLKFSSHH